MSSLHRKSHHRAPSGQPNVPVIGPLRGLSGNISVRPFKPRLPSCPYSQNGAYGIRDRAAQVLEDSRLLLLLPVLLATSGWALPSRSSCGAGTRTRITSGQPYEIPWVMSLGQRSTPPSGGALPIELHPQRLEHCRAREMCLVSPGCRHILNALTVVCRRCFER